MSVRLAAFSLVLAAFSAPALAQQPPSDVPSDVIVPNQPPEALPPADTVDRVPGSSAQQGPRQPFAMSRAEGVRIVKPGALLFASYDTDKNGRITREEIEAGALASFKAADKNGDGVMAGFEQNEWAASLGSTNDVLANPMTFDSDLDRSSRLPEFLDGIRKLAQAVADPVTGEISFASLIQPLNMQQQQADRGGPGGPGGPGGGPGGPGGPSPRAGNASAR